MIVIEGSFRIAPENLETARPAMETMMRKSRTEAGCVDYAYTVDLLDQGLVRVSERWSDSAALAAHARSPHMAEWRAAAGDIALSGRSLRPL